MRLTGPPAAHRPRGRQDSRDRDGRDPRFCALRFPPRRTSARRATCRSRPIRGRRCVAALAVR